MNIALKRDLETVDVYKRLGKLAVLPSRISRNMFQIGGRLLEWAYQVTNAHILRPARH